MSKPSLNYPQSKSMIITMKRPTEEKLQEGPIPGKSLPTPRSPMRRPDWCGAVQPVVCPGFLPFGRRRSFDGGVEFWPLEVGRCRRDHLSQASLLRLCLKWMHNKCEKGPKKRVSKISWYDQISMTCAVWQKKAVVKYFQKIFLFHEKYFTGLLRILVCKKC